MTVWTEKHHAPWMPSLLTLDDAWTPLDGCTPWVGDGVTAAALLLGCTHALATGSYGHGVVWFGWWDDTGRTPILDGVHVSGPRRLRRMCLVGFVDRRDEETNDLECMRDYVWLSEGYPVWELKL